MIHAVNRALLQNAERYPVFALILFTEAQPEVTRALEDELYYAALDEISGPDVLVFATLLFPARRTYPQPPPGVLPSVQPVWLEPKENEEIMGWFGIEDRDRLPVLAVFGFTGPTMHYQVYPIDDRSAGAVFASVRDRLQEIRKVLAKHISAPRTESLFRALGWRKSARDVARGVRWFLRIINSFRGATGA
jgi:hypothetical protein